MDLVTLLSYSQVQIRVAFIPSKTLANQLWLSVHLSLWYKGNVISASPVLLDFKTFPSRYIEKAPETLFGKWNSYGCLGLPFFNKFSFHSRTRDHSFTFMSAVRLICPFILYTLSKVSWSMIGSWAFSTRYISFCPEFFTYFPVNKSGVYVFCINTWPTYFSLLSIRSMVEVLHSVFPVTVLMP